MAGEPVARDGGGGPALADSSGTTVILFYCYSDTAAAAEVKRQEELCERLGLYGRVLVSEEGLNGTLAGGHAVVTSYIEDLCSRIPSLGTQDFKFSSHQGSPDTLFPDLQVHPPRPSCSAFAAPAPAPCPHPEPPLPPHPLLQCARSRHLPGPGISLTL